MAEARFSKRRALVLEEANALGTTFLRTDLLPEPHADNAKALLREYVRVRLGVLTPEKLPEAMAKSAQLHEKIWAEASASAKLDPHSVAVGLFIHSLNALIDLHETRVAIGIYARLPATILIALMVLSCLAVVMIGYTAALAHARTPLQTLGVIVSIAVVLTLIVDLDRPWQTMFAVGRRALADVQATMERSR